MQYGALRRGDKKISFHYTHESSTRDWSAHLNLFKKGLCISHEFDPTPAYSSRGASILFLLT
jgi:hypothetical protein